MPCTARARGTRSTTSIPPFTGTIPPNPPFNDPTNNDPCGRKILLTSTPPPPAVTADWSAHNLCLFHLMMKQGQTPALSPPFTFEP